MQIEEFTVADASAVEEVVALTRAVEKADSPWVHPTTVTTYTGSMRHGWDGETPRCFLARDTDGVAVGSSEFWIGEWDNTDLAWLGVQVHPDRRRRGVGTALMTRMLELTRETGRTKVGVDGWDDEVVRAFADAHGFEKKSQAVNRRQFLADVRPGALDRMYDEAAAAGSAYELVRVVGRTPDELMDKVAVMTAAINDAPLDDLDIEDEVFPPERIRSYEEATMARGRRLYRLIARHRETGDLAGHTVVAVEEDRPAYGHQHDTSVVRAHRGHRLGLLLKAGMLRWLADVEPQLESVDTWNAESNDHMIAVNEALGYRVLGRALQFQRRV
jgi:GNAT superfamily N-acetyltransferase